MVIFLVNSTYALEQRGVGPSYLHTADTLRAGLDTVSTVHRRPGGHGRRESASGETGRHSTQTDQRLWRTRPPMAADLGSCLPTLQGRVPTLRAAATPRPLQVNTQLRKFHVLFPVDLTVVDVSAKKNSTPLHVRRAAAPNSPGRRRRARQARALTAGRCCRQTAAPVCRRGMIGRRHPRGGGLEGAGLTGGSTAPASWGARAG